MDYMLMPIRRYADFKGRSRRKEYWMFMLLQIVLIVIFAIVISALASSAPRVADTVATIVTLGYLALFVIPSLAVQVRRFHDQDKSGWFILMGFIPAAGGLIVLIFMCLPGTRGANRFGPDPIAGHDAQVFD